MRNCPGVSKVNYNIQSDPLATPNEMQISVTWYNENVHFCCIQEQGSLSPLSTQKGN